MENVMKACREFRSVYANFEKDRGQSAKAWEALEEIYVTQWSNGLQQLTFQDWAVHEFHDGRLLSDICQGRWQAHYQALPVNKRQVFNTVVDRLGLERFEWWRIYFFLGTPAVESARSLRVLASLLKKRPNSTLDEVVSSLRKMRDARLARPKTRGRSTRASVFFLSDFKSAAHDLLHQQNEAGQPPLQRPLSAAFLVAQKTVAHASAGEGRGSSEPILSSELEVDDYSDAESVSSNAASDTRAAMESEDEVMASPSLHTNMIRTEGAGIDEQKRNEDEDNTMSDINRDTPASPSCVVVHERVVASSPTMRPLPTSVSQRSYRRHVRAESSPSTAQETRKAEDNQSSSNSLPVTSGPMYQWSGSRLTTLDAPAPRRAILQTHLNHSGTLRSENPQIVTGDSNTLLKDRIPRGEMGRAPPPILSCHSSLVSLASTKSRSLEQGRTYQSECRANGVQRVAAGKQLEDISAGIDHLQPKSAEASAQLTSFPPSPTSLSLKSSTPEKGRRCRESLVEYNLDYSEVDISRLDTTNDAFSNTPPRYGLETDYNGRGPVITPIAHQIEDGENLSGAGLQADNDGMVGETWPSSGWMERPSFCSVPSSESRKDSRSWEENETLTLCRIVLKQCDVGTLAPGQWLNDEIMNSYLSLLSEHYQLDGRHNSEPTVFLENTFFFEKLTSGKQRLSDIINQEVVRSWAKKHDIFAFDSMIIPINMGESHWMLAFVTCLSWFHDMNNPQVPNPKIITVDSLPQSKPNQIPASQIRIYLIERARLQLDVQVDKAQITCQHANNFPLQQNLTDCGVYALTFAEMFFSDQTTFFTEAHDIDAVVSRQQILERIYDLRDYAKGRKFSNDIMLPKKSALIYSRMVTAPITSDASIVDTTANSQESTARKAGPIVEGPYQSLNPSLSARMASSQVAEDVPTYANTKWAESGYPGASLQAGVNNPFKKLLGQTTQFHPALSSILGRSAMANNPSYDMLLQGFIMSPIATADLLTWLDLERDRVDGDDKEMRLGKVPLSIKLEQSANVEKTLGALVNALECLIDDRRKQIRADGADLQEQKDLYAGALSAKAFDRYRSRWLEEILKEVALLESGLADHRLCLLQAESIFPHIITAHWTCRNFLSQVTSQVHDAASGKRKANEFGEERGGKRVKVI